MGQPRRAAPVKDYESDATRLYQHLTCVRQMTDTRSSVLITVDELADGIAGEPGLVLLDIGDDLETRR